MKYDFDSMIDRAHDPYSYSLKWRTDSKLAARMMQWMGYDELPEDRLCFSSADMDFRCAPEIIEALKKTADHGIFGYSGIPYAYYDAVVGWFHERFGWDFSTDSVFPCINGTHDAIIKCIEKFTQPGDGVIVLLPSYSYHMDIEGYGRKFVGVQMNNENGYYTVDYAALEKACAVKDNTMIILVQPHNPTGRVFTEAEILKIGAICRKHGVIIVSDEVHIDIVRKGTRILPVMKVLGSQGVISTVAVNKTFNLAGLSMSNAIIEDPELQVKYRSEFEIASPFGISAVIAAYTRCGEWVDELNEYIDQIIDYSMARLAKDLPKAHAVKPEGTYVLWVDFSGYGLSDKELRAKIDAAHIIIEDGSAFDAINGKQMWRFCLTSPLSQVKELFDRMAVQFKDC